MASPASIGGHPVHPLIPFPIALWVFCAPGTRSAATDDDFYNHTRANL
jgi:hypothetical protein